MGKNIYLPFAKRLYRKFSGCNLRFSYKIELNFCRSFNGWNKKLKTYWCVFDITQKESKRQQSEKQSEDPELWKDPQRAKAVMKQLSILKEEIQSWHDLEKRVQDVLELAQLADESLREELDSVTSGLSLLG